MLFSVESTRTTARGAPKYTEYKRKEKENFAFQILMTSKSSNILFCV